jgi:hypothetical protein
MDIKQLEQAGRLLYGDQWQSNMARDLNIDSRRVRQWMSADRQISGWVATEVSALLDKKQFNINQFLKTINKDTDMTNFINRLQPNKAMINKVAQNPNSTKVAEAVQAQLEGIVMAVYKNNLFKIAGIDADGKKLIEFTASKGDDGLVFWFGEDWQSKVIKIERIGDADELVRVEDVA